MKNKIIIFIYTLFYLYYLYKFIKIINFKSKYKNNSIVHKINIRELNNDFNFKKYSHNTILKNISTDNNFNYYIIPTIYTKYPKEKGYYLYVKLFNIDLNKKNNIKYSINNNEFSTVIQINKILRFYSQDKINLFNIYLNDNDNYIKIFSLNL